MEKNKSLKKGSKAALFVELAQPDEEIGFSKPILVSEFMGKYASLQFNNGCSWGRADGSLAKIYNVERRREGNKIVAIKLNGFNKNPIQKGIPQNVYQAYQAEKCRVLAVGKVEIDHKDGRRDDRRPPEELGIKDFQPLSKAVNCAKREHCKVCRETDQRFDATILGYAVSQWVGEQQYKNTCTGCYWHDPFCFNQKISQGFARKDA